MALQSLIARLGLAAVFAGAALEGETAVVAGGILAHQHLLSLPGVAITGGLGSFVADQAFFLFGRHFRDHPRVKRILDKPAAENILDALEHHPTVFILGFRFLYGLRTVSPVAVGTSEISQLRFLPLNALSAALWAILFTAIGFALGGTLGRYFHNASSIVPIAIGGMLALSFAAFVARIGWKTIRRGRKS